ncbi:MAG: radical SAM protein [Candidatus Aenigmatarchaeota archaeon]
MKISIFDALDFLKSYIGYNLFYYFNSPKILPKIITFSVNDYCNSFCKTCYIWKNNIKEKMKNELSLDEVKKIFSKIGKIYWITITGGEPFMKPNIKEVLETVLEISKPIFITIATNGTFTEKTVKIVDYLTKKFPKTTFIINISLDEVEEKYKDVRGIDAFNIVINTFYELKKIRRKNLIVGINTVISKYNIDRFPLIYNFVNDKLKPDSYIITLAEYRSKLYNENLDFVATENKIKKVLLILLKEYKKIKNKLNIIKLLRYEYYKFLARNKKIKNFEGIASIYIMHNGDVWISYSKPFILGNLRNVNYDLKKLIFCENANKYRNLMKSEKYFTISENAFYVNRIFSLI